MKRNILVGDSDKLPFLPLQNLIEGSSEKVKKRFYAELDEAYAGKLSESSRKTEPLVLIKSYLPYWLEELDIGLTEEILIRYVLQKDGEYFELGSMATRRLLDSVGGRLSAAEVKKASRFSEAFSSSFKVNLNSIVLPKDKLRELMEAARKISEGTPDKEEPSPGDHLSTQTNFACLICHAMCCPTHGEYNYRKVATLDDPADDPDDSPRKAEYESVWERLNGHYEDMLRRDTIRRIDKEDQMDYESSQPRRHVKPCSEDCYLLGAHLGESYEWPESDILAFKSMVTNLHEDAERSCSIAFHFRKPCWQVHRQMEITKPRQEETPLRGRSKRPEWYDNRKKTLKGDWQDMTKAHLHQERQNINPVSMPFYKKIYTS